MLAGSPVNTMLRPKRSHLFFYDCMKTLFTLSLRLCCLLFCLLAAPRLAAQAPAWADLHNFGGAGNDYARHVVVDNTNNALYVCGQFQGVNVDFDPSAGTALRTSNGGGANTDMFIAKYNATTGAYIWAINIGGAGGLNIAYRLALDGTNLYVCGQFGGSCNFNPLGGPINRTSLGAEDGFVAQYDFNGVCNWVTAMNAAGVQSATDITLSGGNIWATGFFNSAANFNPGGSAINLTPLGGTDDIFLVKYNKATGIAASISDGISIGSAAANDRGNGIIADGVGNVWITGLLGPGAASNFNPLGAAFNLTSAGGSDAFVAKYDNTLNLVGGNTAFLLGTGGADDGASLAVDGANNLYVVGSFNGFVNFNPLSTAVNRFSIGSTDAFLASYTPAGILRWVNSFGTPVPDRLEDVVVIGGSVYVCGISGNGILDLDGDVTFSSPTANGASPADIWFGRYDANTGAYKSARRLINATGNEAGYGISADGAGVIYLAGNTSTTSVDLDPRPAAANVLNSTNVGGDDAVVMRYNTTAAETYTWNVGLGVWTATANWTPARENPASDDILIFPNNGMAQNATSTPFQQVGRITAQNPAPNGTTLTALVPGSFLLVNGDASPFDVDIQAMALLTLGNAANQAAIRVTTGSVCNVAATLRIGSLPNAQSYIGGWGTLNVTNTGAISTRGPNGINGLGLQSGAVQIDVASGGTIAYDNAASFSFEGQGVTGFGAIAMKPAITQAKDIKVSLALANERVMLDNSVVLSGALNIDGAGAGARLCVTSANVLTLGPTGNVIDATASSKVLEVISGTVNNPNAGGLTFLGAAPRLILCSDGSMGTSGLFTGNSPTYNANSQLEYNIKDANRTTTNIEIPTLMNGKVLINGFAGTAPLPIVTLNNGKTFNETLTVSNGTLTLGGTTIANGASTLGNAAPATSGKINLNNQSLTFNGNAGTLNASTFIGSATSNLAIGDGNDNFTGNLAFDPGTGLLNNFTVNLAAPNSVNMGSNLSVAGTLTLTQGRVATSVINFLRVANTAPTSVVRTNGWVNGPLERQLLPSISANGTHYIFPIGDAANYRAAQLRDIRTVAGTPVVRMTYAAGGATTFNAPITALASGQNWRLEDVLAGFTNSAMALDNGAAPPANARVVMSAAQAGNYSTIHGSAVGNIVTSAPLLALAGNYFAVGAAPLPQPYLVAPAPAPSTHSNTTVPNTTTPITFSYNENMNPPMPTNLFVHGSLRGFRNAATVSQPAATQLRVTTPAAKTFSPGEVVSVTVTGATSQAFGTNPRPHVYSFRTAVNGGSGRFVDSRRYDAMGIGVARNVTLGDFDNDGKMDILQGSSQGLNLLRQIGTAPSEFTAGANIVSGVTVYHSVAADFDNDGALDIAVSLSSGNVEIRKNNGTGGFGTILFTIGPLPNIAHRLAAADFDGDGDMDIAMGIIGGGSVLAVYTNNGLGTVFPQVFTASVPSPPNVVAGDFDNDGDMDIATTDNTNVQIWRGQGALGGVNSLFLTPTAPWQYPVTTCSELALGDFTGDGYADLAVASDLTNTITILRNSGLADAQFVNIGTLNTGSPGVMPLIGDFDGIGNLDIVAYKPRLADSKVLFYAGNGTGAFALPISSPLVETSNNATPHSPIPAAADMDGDGDLDLVLPIDNGRRTAILFNHQPELKVTTTSPVANAHNVVEPIAIFTSFNQNVTTATAALPQTPPNPNGPIRIYGGMTGGRSRIGGGGSWSGTANSATFNANNHPTILKRFFPGEKVDFTVSTMARISAPLNTVPMTTGTVRQFRTKANFGPMTFFETQRPIAGTNPRSVVSADFNNDGYLDVCAANENSSNLTMLLGGAGGVFGAPTTIPLAGFTGLAEIIAADFNNDGIMDIAVSANPDVAVLLGTGGAAFSAPNGYASGTGGPRYGLAAGDWNGDGSLDILVGNAGALTGNISILPNNGLGVFGSPMTSPLIANAFSIACGDVDNDGDVDAVATQAFGTGNVSVLQNRGTSLAMNVVSVGALAAAYDVDLGDFNNDGWLDIAVTQYSVPNQVAIYLNLGNGMFPAAPNSTHATGDGVTSVVVGDFNGDGALDLITTNEFSSTITVLRGDNAGNFAPTTFETGTTPRSWSAAGDFDNDGDLDFATANHGSGSISILLNTTQPRFVCTAGCGPVNYTPNIAPQRNVTNALTASILTWQFTEPMTTATASFPSTVPGPSGQNGAIRVFGTMRGSRTAYNDAGANWSYTGGMATTATLTPARAFLPNEQIMVSVTNAKAQSGVRARPYVYGFTARAGVGPGTFYESRFSPHSVGLNPFDVVIGDVNNDGFPDMAIANQGGNSVTIRLNDGRGDFPTEAPGSPIAGLGGATSVKFADVNNDGLLDLIAPRNIGNEVFVRLNSGGGNFTTSAPGSPLTGGFNLPFNTALADYDADGDLDLAVANDLGGNVVIRLNNGYGDFTTVAPGSPYAIGANTFGIAAGDVDNDGDIDIVASALVPGAYVLFNDGTGRFTIGPNIPGGTDVRAVVLGRINNDDFLDLVQVNQASNDVTVRFNNGAGAFGAAMTYPMGTAPRNAALADIDGDTDLDLLTANNDPQGVVIRRNDGAGNFAAFGLNSPLNLGGLTKGIALADLDGDNDLDIVAPKNAGSEASVFLNKNPDVITCFGNALQFNAVDSYARVTPATGVNVGTGSFTAEAMIRTPAAGGVFLSAGVNNVNGNGFTLQAQGSMGRLEFRWSNFGTGLSVSSGVNVQDNQWHHVAVVYKALPADSLFIYVDGILRGSGVNPNPGVNNITNPVLTFGSAFGAAPSAFYAGVLDEVRFWNTALSQQTINFHKGLPIEPTHPNWANLQSNWRFNEGAGNTLYDYKSGQLGTLLSTATSLPQWRLSNASCGMMADMYAPPSSQIRLPASTQRPLGTATLTYALAGGGMFGGTILTPASTATYTAWSSVQQNSIDSFTYTATDGTSASTGTVRVQFTPKLQGFTVYAQVGVATALNGTHVIFGGTTPPIKYTWTGLSGASFDLTNPAIPVITTLASVNLTLTIEDALGFTATTTVNVVALGGDALTFSAVQRGLTDGFNAGSTVIVSRSQTPFTASVFRSTTLLQATTASVRWAIAPTVGGTAQFFVQGSSQTTFNNVPTFSTNAVFVWQNAPPQGGSTQAIITLSTTNGLLVFSTQITVTVIANPAQALALAMSQSSSTGTHGVNAGAFNAGQLVLSNGKPFNVAFGAWNGLGVLVPTQATVRATLVGSGGETDGFTITVATMSLINQSADTVRNIAIEWRNPLAFSTTVTLRLQVISGSPLQSTSVVCTLLTFPLEPVITMFSPTTGATSSVVSVQGVNLGNVTSVRVGGVPVSSYTINSPTQISLVVSTGATGLISATNVAGTGQSLVPFVFVSPPSGLMLSTTQAGVGQTLILGGNNLVNIQTIFVGGISALFTTTASGQFLVTVPPQAQSGVVTVQTLGGSAVTPLAIFPQPAITGFSPATVGGGGMITITGANLTNVTSVTISGVPVTSFMVLSSTQIVAVLSTGASSGFIQVQSAGGTATAPMSLVVTSPPTITSVSNTMPSVGAQVFITGSNFTSGMTATLGGVPVVVQFNSPTEIIITMPSGATSGTLTVTTPFGSTSLTTMLTVQSGVVLPSGIDFAPFSGSNGTTVTITGQGFVGVREVFFGGVAAARFTVVSPERIVAVVATGATGNVRVTTTTGTAVSMRVFAYLSPLQLDSLAAVSFFLMTDGFNWTTTANWLSRQPLQTWSGLTVQNGRITSLALPNNKVNGSITSAIVQLSAMSALRTLNLSGNALAGLLPSAIGAMRTLRTLNLSAVGLSGALPQELGNLDSLEVLRLDTNRLTGALEAVFCTLNGTSARQAYRLRELRVNNNRLTGQIPPCIVEFKQLEIVHFQQNQFTGGIPERIVELTALRELLLAQNRLTGALPRSFNRAFTGKTARTSALAALERLDIAGNGFTGALPQGVGEFTALRELRLNDNAFAGALPQGLVALNRLETLDASRNRFTGALPESIGNMRRLRQLSLTNNLLGGTIPESLGECDLLERLELDSNALEGAVPTALATWQNLRVLGLSNNRLTSVPTLTVALTSSRVPFEALRLGGNRLTFESLEDNAALRNSTYSPQDSVGASQNLTFQPATRIALSLTVGGTSNRYQWFKNGSALGAASASGEFTISERATEAENGTYQCRITNPRAPALTLQSRTWQIRVDSAARQPSQPNAVAQPILTYPPNNARFMPYSLDLRWKSAEGADEYEVQLSTNASFSPILRTAIIRTTTFSVSVLQPSQRYVWRVRSLAADGGKSVWSQALFTTANIERPLQMSSIDFERVPLRETSIKEASVSNFSTVPQILNDITILSEAPNDTRSPFRILDDVRGIVIPAGESLTVRISFTPLVLGNTSATSILAFQQRPQDGARRDSTRNILQGIGGAMKLDDVDFDTVRAGGTTIRSANLVNLSSRRITLKSPTIPIQTQENVFSIESFFGLGDITLNPLDTVQVVVRCRVPESSIGRKLAGVLVFGEGDSVRASVRAIARALRPNDIVANISVQPREDNIPPGGAVDLDVLLTTNDITPANISQVFRAIQPQFRGRFRMNRQVLTLDASEKVAQSQVSGDILSVVIPQTGLERIPADESKRSTRLVRIAARAVAGSTNATRLVLENAALAPPLIRGSSAVFIEESGAAGTFTARISQAGGKRLIGSVQSGKLLVKSLKGALELTYSIPADGIVDVSLYDVLGRKLSTLTNEYHARGEYIGTFRTDGLVSGAYFLVLTSAEDIVQKRVDVIR